MHIHFYYTPFPCKFQRPIWSIFKIGNIYSACFFALCKYNKYAILVLFISDNFDISWYNNISGVIAVEYIIDYIVSNYLTLMILLAVIVLMVVNRKENIPATQLFGLGVSLLVVITVLTAASKSFTLAGTTPELIRLHTISDTLKYIIRPVIILIELCIIIQDRKLRIIYSMPAIINAVIFSTALFGSHITFYIDENNYWHDGTDLRHSAYIVQLLYVILLFIHSISFFRQKNTKKSAVVVLIVFQSLSVALLEFLSISNSITDFLNPITALCILEYYIYLSTIYQQEIRDEVARKELELAKSDLLVLKNQLQPHFIYNTLNIIRYMIKSDKNAALECVDSFSEYLKAHIKALKMEDLIPFEQELAYVRDYISLVQIDYTRKIDTVYELGVTDFLIPPLCLEPIVENAIDHGIGHKNGTVTLRTFADENNVFIVIKDSGSSKGKAGYEPVHHGVGLENTRKRIELQCGGTLKLDIKESGAEVTITLPQHGG